LIYVLKFIEKLDFTINLPALEIFVSAPNVDRVKHRALVRFPMQSSPIQWDGPGHKPIEGNVALRRCNRHRSFGYHYLPSPSQM
jgi:hypothetical protein